MPEIKTLISDIYELFNPDVSHEVNEENLEAFAQTVKDITRKRLLEREKNGPTIRFSNLGKPDRVHWYEAKGYPQEKMNSKTYMKFMYGDIIEAMLIFLVKESGHVVEDEQLEVSVDGVLGHIDCRIDGVVCDVKSAAPYSFTKFVKGDIYDDVFSKVYIDQLCGYSSVLTPGTPPFFLAFDKVDGSMCTLSVPNSIAVDHKPEDRIAELKEVVASDVIPPRCYEDEPDGASGNRKLSLGCSYCNHKFRCWEGLRAFAYSGKPRYLTHVEKEPNVPEFFPHNE